MNETEKQILENQLAIMRYSYFKNVDSKINIKLLQCQNKTRILLDPIKEESVPEKTHDAKNTEGVKA